MILILTNFFFHFIPIIIMTLYLPILFFLLHIVKSQRPIVLTSTPIQINLQACQMESNNQWTRINIGIEGGARPYQFFYDQYPDGWRYAQSSIFIPRTNLAFTRKFPLRVRVIDQFGNQARASIVFLVSQGNIAVYPFIYPYEKTFDDNFFNDGGFRDRPRLIRSEQFYSQFQNNYFLNNQNYIMAEQSLRYRQKIAQEQYSNSFEYNSYPSPIQRGIYAIDNTYDPFHSRIDSSTSTNNIFQMQNSPLTQNRFGNTGMLNNPINMINYQQQPNTFMVRNSPPQANNIASFNMRSPIEQTMGINLIPTQSSANQGGFTIPTHQMNHMNSNNYINKPPTIQKTNSLGFMDMGTNPYSANDFLNMNMRNTQPITSKIQPNPILQPNNFSPRNQNAIMSNIGPLSLENSYRPQSAGSFLSYNPINPLETMRDPRQMANNIQIKSLTTTPKNPNLNSSIKQDKIIPVNILTPNRNFNGLNNPLNNIQGWSLVPSQQTNENTVPLKYNLVRPGSHSYVLVASDQVDEYGLPASYRLQPVQSVDRQFNSLFYQQQYYPQQFYQNFPHQFSQFYPTSQNVINQQRFMEDFSYPNWFLVQEKGGKTGLPPGVYLIASNTTNNPLSFLPFFPAFFPQPHQQQQQPIVINIDNAQVNRPNNTINTSNSIVRTGVENASFSTNKIQNNSKPIPPQPKDNPNLNPTRVIQERANITNATINITSRNTTSDTTTNTTNITNSINSSINSSINNNINSTNIQSTKNGTDIDKSTSNTNMTNTANTANTTNITNVTSNRNTTSLTTPIVVTILPVNYSGLPNNLQIDDLIRKQDGIGLKQVIDRLYSFSNLTCEQKYAFGLNLLAKLQIEIKSRGISLDSIEKFLAQAKKSYENFMFQISQKKVEQTTLNTQQQKQKIEVQLKRLDGLQSQLNDQKTTIPPLTNQFENYQKLINMEQSKSEIDRKEIVRQKTLLSETESIAQSLINKLKAATAERANAMSSINKIVSIINQSQTKIKNNNDNISKLEREILQLQFTVDNEKYNYGNLEAEVQKYREQIARATRRQAQIIPEINNLQEKLRIQKGKLANEQLDKIKQMIKELQRSLPNLQKFVDQNYYKCNNASNLTTNQNGSSIVYIVGVPDFQKYIQSSYLMQPDWSKMSLQTQQIILNHANILDPLWQGAFGIPYESAQFINTKEFSFKDDFNCLNPSSLQSGLSEIASIGNRFIMVNSPEGMIKLNLGTCTRLQSTLYLPSIGQKIYWRGSPGKIGSQFNIYRATCI